MTQARRYTTVSTLFSISRLSIIFNRRRILNKWNMRMGKRSPMTGEAKLCLLISTKSMKSNSSKQVSEFQNFFDAHLGGIHRAKHQVELKRKGTRSVHSALYRADPAARHFWQRKFGRWIRRRSSGRLTEYGPIQSSFRRSMMVHWDLALTIVDVVQKQSGTRTIFEAVCKCFDLHGEACILSTLVTTPGCSQIKINERDRSMTAFTDPYGLYRFVQVSFRLTSTSATFLRVMYVALSSVTKQSALMYVGYILVLSEYINNSMTYIPQVVIVQRDAVINFRLWKCSFYA